MGALGISAALGAFMAGVVLANSSYRHTLEADIQPFKGLLLGLFFISVGMSIDFNLIINNPLLILCGVLLLLAIKGAILYALSYLFKMKTPFSITFSLLLCQSGEFAFVIMQAGALQGVVTQTTANYVNAIAALSMMLTPLLLIYNDRLTKILAASYKDENPEYDTISETHCPVIIAGYGRVGQVIGRLLYAQGLDPIILEQSPEQINLLRHFGNKVYFGDAMREDVLQAAGIEKAKIFVITLGNPELALALTKMVKELHPHITILARARNRRHAYELHEAGAHIVRRELLDSSLWLGQRLLEQLGMRKYDARNSVMCFKKHDQEVLEHSFEFFTNEKEMLSFNRQSSQELKQILADDLASSSNAHLADGWGSIEEDILNEENEEELKERISARHINQALKDISNDNMNAFMPAHGYPDDNKNEDKDNKDD
jgi:voltage-gated potassium channel Kch